MSVVSVFVVELCWRFCSDLWDASGTSLSYKKGPSRMSHRRVCVCSCTWLPYLLRRSPRMDFVSKPSVGDSWDKGIWNPFTPWAAPNLPVITPDILISKQFLNLGTLLINFHGVWFGVFLRFWVFWVSLFVFNLDECEICLFWHGGSACPLLTIEDAHAVHQWECTLAWLVTLHSLKLAVPCSEISRVQ